MSSKAEAKKTGGKKKKEKKEEEALRVSRKHPFDVENETRE